MVRGRFGKRPLSPPAAASRSGSGFSGSGLRTFRGAGAVLLLFLLCSGPGGKGPAGRRVFRGVRRLFLPPRARRLPRWRWAPAGTPREVRVRPGEAADARRRRPRPSAPYRVFVRKRSRWNGVVPPHPTMIFFIRINRMVTPKKHSAILRAGKHVPLVGIPFSRATEATQSSVRAPTSLRTGREPCSPQDDPKDAS